MEKLFEVQKIVIEQFERVPFYNRGVFSTFSFDNTICGVVGPRGVGKTTFLLDQVIKNGAKNQEALYVSADNIYFLEHKLLELVDSLYKSTNVGMLCIDEIHKYPNWNQELKNIADTYPSIKVIFSGSSAVDLIKSKYDLSRRVTLYHLNGFSFREYLEFNLNKKMPLYSLEELVKHHINIASSLDNPKILFHFREYLKRGYYPFYKKFKHEHEFYQVIRNTVQKNIYEDIANCHKLKTGSLSTMEALLKFTLNSSAGELSAYKLSNTLKKDFSTVSDYLRILHEAGLIRYIYPQKTGHSFLKNPSKIYPDNTNLIYAAYLPIPSDQLKGKVRETFFVTMLQNSASTLFYSKVGDFKVNSYYFEIGGKNKDMSQLANSKEGFLVLDDILIGSKQTIPLYLFGLLY